MKHFVLAFLLFLFSATYCSAQQVTPRDIVLKSLKKHTSGKKLTQYVVRFEYDKPGKTPDELLLKNPLLALLDSLMKTMPDSVRNKMEKQHKELNDKYYQELVEQNVGNRQWIFADLSRNKTAWIKVNPNNLKGTLDSNRTVYGPDFGRSGWEFNPVSVVQLMAEDTTELHYTGVSMSNSIEYHQIQFKWVGKWISVYFDMETNVLTQLVENQTDEDPLIGRGPEHYKKILNFKNFKLINGFLIPNSIEEITTRSDLTTRKKLNWISLNKPIPDSVFKPVPKRDEMQKFRTVHISDSLFVVERQSSLVNSRSLVRIAGDNQLEVFSESFDKKTTKIIENESAGSHIRNIYMLGSVHSVTDLSALFVNKIQVVAPRGYGTASEQNIRTLSPKEDSIWRAASSAGLLTTFDKEFENENLKVFVLSRYTGKPYQFLFVWYYLPKEKVVYLRGNPYSAEKEKQNASLREKQVYDRIISGEIAADKIVYSGAYLDDAPVFMTFQDFEKRIKNTDFSVSKDKKEE